MLDLGFVVFSLSCLKGFVIPMDVGQHTKSPGWRQCDDDALEKWSVGGKVLIQRSLNNDLTCKF